MNEVRIVGNDVIISVDEVVATIENAALIEDNKRLQAENEQLRELVRAAWKCTHSGLSCSDCRTIAGGCTLKTAMSEMGVEV